MREDILALCRAMGAGGGEGGQRHPPLERGRAQRGPPGRPGG